MKALLRQAIPAAVQDVATIEDASEERAGERINEDAERAAELESALQKRVLELFTAETDVLPPLVFSEPHERLLRREEAERHRQQERQELERARQERQEKLDRERRDAQLARKKHREEWSKVIATYPPQREGERVAEVIRQLPPRAIAQLGRFVGDVADQAREDQTVSYVKAENTPYGRGNQQLIDGGLVEVIGEEDNRVRLRLTSDGIIAARLLRADEQAPEWASDLF
ncbi:hypothetical protein [Mycobacterium camsae]|uniref:hypothetical protein n=1 Tax=Mycobacterium gordonae TaxID=1778 RepID=UPI001981559E|nr:hypothetical protein [Mycobacterium gordonae]